MECLQVQDYTKVRVINPTISALWLFLMKYFIAEPKTSSLLIIPKMKNINSKLPKYSRKNFRRNDQGSYILVEAEKSITSNKTQKSFKLLSEESKAKTQNLSSEIREINARELVKE